MTAKTQLERSFEQGIKRDALNEIQREAVVDYLILHGELDRDFGYNVGLAACGRIKNLGGRIHELRKDGWDIKTEVRDSVCSYVLITAPAPRELQLV